VGGSGKGFTLSRYELQQLQSTMEERLAEQRRDAEVNSLLRRELLAANDRDDALVNARLDEIQEVLGEQVEEFDRVLFGGSLAKHTYVEGLSDVDSLVVLHDSALLDQSPAAFREEFAEALRSALSPADVEVITVGLRAVTVHYRDGAEVQLLPAVERKGSVSISAPTGREWQHGIHPQAFTDQLTAVNAAQSRMVVPTIKLAKQLLASQVPGEERPSGYHTEALGVAAFQAYDGPRTPKAMLGHLVRSASQRVREPMADVTGQSAYVDEALGPAQSVQRARLSRTLENLARALDGAPPERWRELLAI
jgi:hypothetical protein